jgi:hypothetical protein
VKLSGVTSGRWAAKAMDLRPGIQEYSPGLRGVQVVIQHPTHCRVPLGFGINSVGLFTGVGAQQVMECEPTGVMLFDEMRPI